MARGSIDGLIELCKRECSGYTPGSWGHSGCMSACKQFPFRRSFGNTPAYDPAVDPFSAAIWPLPSLPPGKIFSNKNMKRQRAPLGLFYQSQSSKSPKYASKYFLAKSIWSSSTNNEKEKFDVDVLSVKNKSHLQIL